MATRLLITLVKTPSIRTEEELTYTAFMQMFKTGLWLGEKVKEIEVLSKHENKGPNKVVFE